MLPKLVYTFLLGNKGKANSYLFPKLFDSLRDALFDELDSIKFVESSMITRSRYFAIEESEKFVRMITCLSSQNITHNATVELDGKWLIRFSNEENFLNRRLGKRGVPNILIEINTTAGFLAEYLEFPNNKGSLQKAAVKYNLVSVAGNRFKCQKAQIAFNFKKRWIFNNMRIGQTLSKFLPISENDIDLLVVYIDEEIVIFRSFNSQLYTVLARAYEAWDPSIGWTYITAA